MTVGWDEKYVMRVHTKLPMYWYYAEQARPYHVDHDVTDVFAVLIIGVPKHVELYRHKYMCKNSKFCRRFAEKHKL